MLPRKSSSYQPTLLNQESLQHRFQENKDRMVRNYNEHSKSLHPFSPSTPVWVQNRKQWSPATIVKQAEEPRSYWITDPSGNQHRRNRSHLRERHASSRSLPTKEYYSEKCPIENTPSSSGETPQLMRPSSELSDAMLSPSSFNVPLPESPTSSGRYQTRAGRFVKPPKRLDL